MTKMEQFLLLTVLGFVVGTCLHWILQRMVSNIGEQRTVTHAVIRTVFTVRGWRNVMASLTVVCFVANWLSPTKSLLSWLSDEPTNPYPSFWDQLGEWPWLSLFGLYLLLTIVLACMLAPDAVQRAWDKAQNAARERSSGAGAVVSTNTSLFIAFITAFVASLLAGIATGRKGS